MVPAGATLAAAAVAIVSGAIPADERRRLAQIGRGR